VVSRGVSLPPPWDWVVWLLASTLAYSLASALGLGGLAACSALAYSLASALALSALARDSTQKSYAHSLVHLPSPADV